jgi:kinesin family protein 5
MNLNAELPSTSGNIGFSNSVMLTCYVFNIESNQDKIVAAGGLSSLLKLLGSSEDETIRRVAAGAIANLAMNGKLAAV